jgi:hypothetical protein
VATAELLKAVWSPGSFLPDIDVKEVVPDLTEIIDALHIAWANKASGTDKGPAAKAVSPDTCVPELPVASPQLAMVSTTERVTVPDSGEQVLQSEPVGEQAPERASGGWWVSPWAVAVAGLSACAVLLTPLHVLRSRRHRKHLTPPS